MIQTILSSLMGIFVLFPFGVSVSLLIVYRRIGKKPTVKKIADLTTPFLFLSIYFTAHVIFGDGVGFTIAIASIVIALFFTIYEYRRVKDFQIVYLLRKVWRLFFILLMIAYFLLILIGIGLAIYAQFT